MAHDRIVNPPGSSPVRTRTARPAATRPSTVMGKLSLWAKLKTAGVPPGPPPGGRMPFGGLGSNYRAGSSESHHAAGRRDRIGRTRRRPGPGSNRAASECSAGRGARQFFRDGQRRATSDCSLCVQHEAFHGWVVEVKSLRNEKRCDREDWIDGYEEGRGEGEGNKGTRGRRDRASIGEEVMIEEKTKRGERERKGEGNNASFEFWIFEETKHTSSHKTATSREGDNDRAGKTAKTRMFSYGTEIASNLLMVATVAGPGVQAFVLFCTTARMSANGSQYYRKDGVRIAHDPYAPGMAEKYGAPGETDSDGFDPYADSVGPGIYGETSGKVKRDAQGKIVIGRQYQNHNPRPGPVYSGEGYTDMSKALSSGPEAVKKLLQLDPSLVHEISTGSQVRLTTLRG
eukprot:747250-Hanusia_phi.AAC.3